LTGEKHLLLFLLGPERLSDPPHESFVVSRLTILELVINSLFDPDGKFDDLTDKVSSVSSDRGGSSSTTAALVIVLALLTLLLV
jgi:hypothetical protein